MSFGILLVDDQRDILRLLHATLDSLKNEELEIIEAPSGEEALLEVTRHRIDLLVADYRLPGITGVELMHKVRVRQPDVKVILVTGMSDRDARDQMLNAGAMAIFDKPIPLADFLDAVERGLGIVRTIFPPESDAKTEAKRSRISDLLANFRQDIQAQAVFLINERGLVVARAGDLHDSSMEVSLLSALTAIFSAGVKIAKFNRQESLDQYFVFRGGDHDLLLIPIEASYALLLAGSGLASRDRILETVEALLAVRDEIGRSLRSMGVTSELKEETVRAASASKKKGKTGKPPQTPAAPEIEALFKEAGKQESGQEDVDAFWNRAAEQHANKSTDPDILSYEEARKMGLTPDKDE